MPIVKKLETSVKKDNMFVIFYEQVWNFMYMDSNFIQPMSRMTSRLLKKATCLKNFYE